jgi:hypothetical protein
MLKTRQLYSVFLIVGLCSPALAQTLTTDNGILPDGTEYRIDYPDNFNGNLLIGLDYAGGQYRNEESALLLSQGYALAGTTRLVTGWDTEASVGNQLQTLDIYESLHGRAEHTLSYGRSLGAHTGSVIVHYHHERFDGALLACGGLAGVVGMWNQKMDAMFVVKTLLAEGNPNYPVMQIPDDFAERARPAWLNMLEKAQETPQGRARIALAAVLGQLPVWADGAKELAQAYDLEGLQEGLYDSLGGSPLPLAGQAMSSRNELTRRSGGSISFNTGVDYREMLHQLKNADIVYELYRMAELDLDADLDTLAEAPRVTADPQALQWVSRQVWHGQLPFPVLTLNNIGDNISGMSAQQFFGSVVEEAGRAELLRQSYVNSAGHCGFSPAETATAVATLIERIESGQWGDTTNPYQLNNRALSLEAGPARFIPYEPEPFQRPVDVCDLRAMGVDVDLPPAYSCRAP